MAKITVNTDLPLGYFVFADGLDNHSDEIFGGDFFPKGGFNAVKSDSTSVTYKMMGGITVRVSGDFNEAGTRGRINSLVLIEKGVEILTISQMETSPTLQSLSTLSKAASELIWAAIFEERQSYFGFKGRDSAIGYHGGDFYGRGGDDIFDVAGDANYFGGSGFDTVTYTYATSRVVASLSDASALNQGEAAGDKYDSIERLIGTAFDDLLIGDSGANELNGTGGADWLYGGLGADKLIGGEGIDIASYYSALFPTPGTKGVIASLADPTGNTNEAAGDTYFGIEGLAGTAFQDTLVGDDEDNVLIGGEGNDYIKGGLGADTLTGDTGGGAAADDFDSFVYASIAEGGDTITDFRAHDFILISKSGFGLSDDFTLAAGTTYIVGSGVQATTGHWTFLFDTTKSKLYFDEDGDGAGQPELIAELTTGYAPTVDQLVLV
jgi:serralysin